MPGVLAEVLVRDLMVKEVVTAKKDITVKECIDLLFKRYVGSVVVINEERKIVGIFTEHDAVRIVAQNISLDTPLEKVMSTNIHTVYENTTFSEAKNIMNLHKIKRLPVISTEGQVIGLFSIRNLIDEIAEVGS
jgi:CBS domain-containing protein